MRAIVWAVAWAALTSACGGSGSGSTTPGSATPPKVETGSPRIAAIAVAKDMGCVITRADRRVFCWDTQQVALPVGGGDGSKPAFEIPSAVGASALAIGYDLGCAIVDPKKLVCWPTNDPAQAGAVAVEEPLTDVSAIAPVGASGPSGTVGVAAVASGGAVYWLSDESSTPVPFGIKPPDLAGISGAVSVTGTEYGGCALLASGKVACAGGGAWEMPDGSVDPTIDELANATALVAGGGSTASAVCALDAAGSLRCLSDDSGTFNFCLFNTELCKTTTPWGACSAPDCSTTGQAGASIYHFALPARVGRVISSIQGYFIADFGESQAAAHLRFLPLLSAQSSEAALVSSCDDRFDLPHGYALDAYDIALDNSTEFDACAILAVGPDGSDEVRCSLAYRDSSDTKSCKAVKIELPL